MALVEFQNNSAPYLSAENLNNNFNEVNIVSKDNNEYLLRMNDKTVLKTGADGSLFASANNNNVVLRPNGHNSSVGQAILSTTGIFSAKNIDGVYFKSFNSTTTASITSVNGYGCVLIVSSQFVCVLELTPSSIIIHDIYGTHGTMSASINNNVVSLTGLYNWDHYIFIGSNNINNIS